MPRGRQPRQYPDDIVERVRVLYASGLTVREVQAQIGTGYRAQTIIERHGIPMRRATPRDQRGEHNAAWRGSEATYAALHLRVESARGKPQECQRCGVTGFGHRYEWANLTGQYEEVNDYERMCASCHRTYDASRRRELGTSTVPDQWQRR